MIAEQDDAIGLCLAGTISPEVAVARLLLGGADAAAIAAAVAARRPDPPNACFDERWHVLAGMAQERAGALDALAAEVAAVGSNHEGFGGADGIARIAAFFDRQAARFPEAGVALFSLGDPAILAAATAELVDWLDAEKLLGADAAVLDLGCGIGRVAAALAPRCGQVLGLDVSANMVREAQRRCAAWPNARFAVTGGRDLDALPAAAFDLVLAVDSFPYVVQAGAADAHVAGTARALRPGGALCILNLSYRQDLAADQADAANWAARHGFALLPGAGRRPFRLWDGAAFVLRRDGKLAGVEPARRQAGPSPTASCE